MSSEQFKVDNDEMTQAIASISAAIVSSSERVADEQHYPQRHADDMDEFIKKGQLAIQKLRKIREELEDLASGLVE